MNSSKVILDKIVGDSNVVIEGNLKKAKDAAQDIENKANIAAEEKVAIAEKGLQADYDEIIRRSVVVAGLDAKKIVMSAKAKAVDNLFAKAIEEIANLDKKKYLSIIENLLKKHAEDGDVVVICERDKDKITKKFVDDVAAKMGIKLTLSKQTGNFHGGVVLASKNCDKNLSFDMELLAIREESETQIADMLFEEK